MSAFRTSRVVSFGVECAYSWRACLDRLSNLLLGLREEEFYELARPSSGLDWIGEYRGKWTLAAVGWGLAPTASALTGANLTLASNPFFRQGYLSELKNPYDDFGSAVNAAMRLSLVMKDRLAIVSDVNTGMRGVNQYLPGDRVLVDWPDDELILIADNLPRELDARLEAYGEVSRNWNRMGEATALVVRTDKKIGSEELAEAPMLKLIVTATHGLDHIDMEEVRRRAIIVERAPVRARAVAELALGMILSLSRGICSSDRMMRERLWAKGRVKCFELAGKRAGVISMGIVGSEIAELLRSIGMHVDYYDKYKVGGIGLERVLMESDVIILASPLTEETRGLIGRRELSMMRDGAILINVGRGELLDLEAALEALESGKLGGLGLDVFPREPPFGDAAFERLLELDNVVVTPHLGGTSRESERRVVGEVTRIFGKWMGARYSIDSEYRANVSISRRKPF
ncbi:MAG: NAD(P)-dependent oxidoreductase [Candidatus Korarchaeum sp.]